MLVWEAIVSADRKRDLAQPRVYPLWFHELIRGTPPNLRIEGDRVTAEIRPLSPDRPLGLLPFAAAWDTPDGGLWCTAIQEMWEVGIRSLRFAVREVRKVKTRAPGIDSNSAREMWSTYVSCLKPIIRFVDGKFRGLQLVAAPGSLLKANPAFCARLDPRQRELCTSIDALFQKAFSALVDGMPAEHYCGGCGRAMDSTTPTGRVSRASICPRCSLTRWKKRTGAKAVREQWRINKRDQREGERPLNTNKRKGS
jgi:hypothetical protein